VTLSTQVYLPLSGDDLPVVVFMPGYDGGPDNFTEAYKQGIADEGICAVFPRARGRGAPSTGSKDDSGLEIQDVVDAVRAARAAHPTRASQSIAYISGYSGGGGIVLNALCKFPDFWAGGVDHFGMSSYSAWYSEYATYRASMETRIGGTPAAVPNNYLARNARSAITNFTGGHLWIIHDPADTTVLPAQSEAVTDAMDGAGLTNYEYHGATAGGHTYPIPAAEPLWMPEVLAGTHPAWTVAASGTLKIAGYLETKRFTLWLGTGVEEFGTVVYNMTTRVFTITSDTGAADYELTLKGQTPSTSISATINGVEDTQTSDADGNVTFTGSIV
jgi:dipeptidyl aminopeptidase/acylaminoacyl peptidase